MCKILRLGDCKGGWKKQAWKGPYVIKEVHTNKRVTLLGKNQQALRKKIPVANLKRYNSAVSEQEESMTPQLVKLFSYVEECDVNK